jgi:hypothetical protein
VVSLRKRLGLRTGGVTYGCIADSAWVAAATPLNKWRYIAMGAAYMWTFKVTWELPYEMRVNSRRSVHICYPIQSSANDSGDPSRASPRPRCVRATMPVRTSTPRPRARADAAMLVMSGHRRVTWRCKQTAPQLG